MNNLTAKKINQAITAAHKRGHYCFACSGTTKIRIINAMRINGIIAVKALSTGIWQSLEDMIIEEG
jgi:hypothetical protein